MNIETQTWDSVEVLIGTSRRIDIYSKKVSELETAEQKQELSEMDNVAEAFPNGNYMLIGLINGGYPLIVGLDNQKNTNAVFCLNPLDIQDKLIPVAKNIESLIKISKCIRDSWKEYPNERALSKNEVSIALKNKTIKTIAEIDPTADLSFWDWLGFNELSISMY